MEFHPTSATLIQRVKNRIDEQSWEEFVHYYKPFIFRVVRISVDGHHDCEDLVQKILLTCWEKLPDFEYRPGESRFRTWLCVIARNLTLRFLRDSGRYNNKINSLEPETEEAKSEVARKEEDEWQLYISNLAWQNIKENFEGNALDCFMLMSEGLSANSVAEKLKISPGSVYVLKKRVTEKLYREINRLDRELS